LKCHANMISELLIKLIEMMEVESKIIVNWSYDVKISKGSSQKYNLN
jgi:hypothetical protein